MISGPKRTGKWHVAEFEVKEILVSGEDELDILLDSLGPVISRTKKTSSNVPGEERVDGQGNDGTEAQRLKAVED